MKNSLVPLCINDLSFDFLLVIRLLALVIDVIDSQLVPSIPKLGHRQFNYFQTIFLLVERVHENIFGCGLLVCFKREGK